MCERVYTHRSDVVCIYALGDEGLQQHQGAIDSTPTDPQYTHPSYTRALRLLASIFPIFVVILGTVATYLIEKNEPGASIRKVGGVGQTPLDPEALKRAGARGEGHGGSGCG
jgi:hypothetical protein